MEISYVAICAVLSFISVTALSFEGVENESTWFSDMTTTDQPGSVTEACQCYERDERLECAYIGNSTCSECYIAVPREECISEWLPWESWSSCNATCGSGHQSRHRVCNDTGRSINQSRIPCNGSSNETYPCESFTSCQVSAEWSPWESWSTCDATCGSGNQSRYRVCNHTRHELNQNLAHCNGSSNETQSCESTIRCQDNAEWSPWESWSTCNTICGSGNQSRYRVCNHTRHELNQTLAACHGSSYETQSCESTIGCQDNWTDWTQCSATCNGGVQERTRPCGMVAVTQPARGEALECNGTYREKQVCGRLECELNAEEEANGVYVVLGTMMTVEDYYSIRDSLRQAIIRAVNSYCSDGLNFGICCPNRTMWSYNGTQSYVDNETLVLKGAFKSDAYTLYFLLLIQPNIETNPLCNGPPSAARRRRAASSFYLSPATVTEVASSPTFTTALTAAALASGFNVTNKPPVTATSAASLKAMLIGSSTSALVTAADVPAKQSSNLGAIVGGSVGGGLVLLGAVVVTFVIVKKKQAKTGIALISGDQNGYDSDDPAGPNSAVLGPANQP